MKRPIVLVTWLMTALIVWASNEIVAGRGPMNTEATTLQWQWPAGRTVEQKFAVRISSVEPESSGWLGLRKSPSFGDALPEATIVRGEVVEGSDDLRGGSLQLRAPKKELGDADAGDLAAIGVIDGGVAICFSVIPPSTSQADLKDWLGQWNCD